ncbi:MAG: translation initiation factor IF-3 [Clostridia bacterium]|nr:translation initiation factor IF-3 [Clostridia bacterium]
MRTDDSVRIFCFWRCTVISTAKELQINDEIKAKEVRLVGSEGEQLGIMDLNSAKEYAYSRELDLVLLAPNAEPPVCRAMDYGKYRFERDKREKEAKKKQQVIRVKEIQLSCRIDKHDFDTRVNQACKFLQGGDKVRAVLRFKGREMAHTDLGREVIERFEEACKEAGASEKKPVLEGRFMSVTISPLGKK